MNRIPEFLKRPRNIVIIAALLFLFWFIPPVWKLKGGYTTVTQWRKSTGAMEVEVGPEKDNWISINNVSRHVLYAFVAAEDMRFYEHNGLDFYEMKKSFQLNMKKKKYVRGGSTISQQVVKMATLSRDKSIIRKVREIVGTLILEAILSKDEILEWYINLAEFGDGVYGLRAAAKHYFQTKPELLTIQQATHLALVLPSPNGWSVGLRRRNLTDFGHRRFASIITRMKLAGYITEAQWINALATGNFGRPLHSYERIIARVRQREALARGQDLEELPEAVEEETQDVAEDPLDEAPVDTGPREMPQKDDLKKKANTEDASTTTKPEERSEAEDVQPAPEN